MKTDQNGTTEFVGDLLPLRLFHPLIRKPFPFSTPSYSSTAPGKNTLLPDYHRVLPSFFSAILAPNNNPKMAKLDGISGDRAKMIDENFGQYRDILKSPRDIRDIQLPQDILNNIQDARTSEDVKHMKSSGPCHDDLPPTMLSQYHVNFHDVHPTGKDPDGLSQAMGPHDREGSYSGQGYLDCGSRRFGSEFCGNLNVSGADKSSKTTEAPPSACGNFYSASGGETILRTVTSPAASFLPVKPKTGGAGEEGDPTRSPNAMTFDPEADRFLASRESRRDDDDVIDDVIENGADPSRSSEDRNKSDEFDQDLSFDDPNASKGGDGERKEEENDELQNEDNTYSCPVCVFTTTDSLVFLPHVIHHCRQPRAGGPPYNPEDRKRRLSGGHLNHQPLGSSRKKGFHCKKCDFESEDKDIYYEHLASHIKIESRYSCVLCSFVTGLRHHITYHICNHYGIKSIRCNIDKCNYVCINQSMLKSHLKKHPLQTCSHCHFTTKSNLEAEKHVRETDHSVGLNLRKADEMNLQHPGCLGSQETQGRFYGVHQTDMASRPERSFGVPLPPYLNPAAMAGNSFLHGLVSPLMWPGAMADGVMNHQNVDHSFRNLGPDVSPSFPQSLMSQKQWAAQYANASDLYHQFLSFQKNFPSATVPPVTGFPPSTRVQDPTTPNSKKLLPIHFFNEASLEKNTHSSASGEVFKSQNMSRRGQKFLQDLPQRKENTKTTTAPLDLTKNQPSPEYANTQFGGSRPLSDPTFQEQRNDANASCEDVVMMTSSKFCRRKGVARKVIVDQKYEDYARFETGIGLPNCEKNIGRPSSDGSPWSRGRPLSNGRPSSEGCVTSLGFDSWHTRPSQKGESSPDTESGDGGGGSALRDLISASEALLPVGSRPLLVQDQVKQTPSCKDRSSVLKDSSRPKGEREISRSPPAQKKLPNTYDCGHCGIRFQDYILYSMHSGYHNFNNPLQCNFCGRKYDNFYEFYEHIGKVEHPES